MTDHPDLLSGAPVKPGEPRADLTLKGLPAARARALLAVLGRLEDGSVDWVPPADDREAWLIQESALFLGNLERHYAKGPGR